MKSTRAGKGVGNGRKYHQGPSPENSVGCRVSVYDTPPSEEITLDEFECYAF